MPNMNIFYVVIAALFSLMLLVIQIVLLSESGEIQGLVLSSLDGMFLA